MTFEPMFASVDQFAKIIGVGRSKAWELAISGEIKTIRVGRRRLVPIEEIENWKARAIKGAA